MTGNELTDMKEVGHWSIFARDMTTPLTHMPCV